MVKNNVLKGVVLVGMGASSYGMLATFVKKAYIAGYTTAEVTASQILLGIAGMLLINIFQKAKKGDTVVKASPKNRLQLIVAGTSMGFTSVFYYLAVFFKIPVSICIVLLMQTVWMSVLLEAIIAKKFPSAIKLASVGIVLVGTVLAANLIYNTKALNITGIFFGLLAAASFTATMFTSNTIATHVSSAQRSLFMLMGGAVIVLGFTAFTWPGTFNFEIFLTWGLVLALFGTIIPPILLNAGFPRTGLGLGSIVSSLELPVSVTMAYVILHEQVNLLQWLGIALILGAIVLMNIKMPGQK
ncbi:EamA family transporter [Flavobacterium album]|uniref:EamA family transporter n=1 Tax=Flavobacterium album TaxID=2175091 RepID=A0A2S1QTG9_9FLAO|nr:DMT family transporter [Flavobacterium album]AWH83730.1 EamA family transporter [Flavobacterium album]